MALNINQSINLSI